MQLGSSAFSLDSASSVVISADVAQVSGESQKRPIADAIRLTPTDDTPDQDPTPTGPYIEAEDYFNTSNVSPWTEASSGGVTYMVVPDNTVGANYTGTPLDDIAMERCSSTPW